MEKIVEMNALFDYYSAFLTDKQKEIFELYYEEDLSLGEIAEKAGVSRQNVYDHLKRTEKLLKECEEKLGLIAEDEKREERMNKVHKILASHRDSLGADYDKLVKLLS